MSTGNSAITIVVAPAHGKPGKFVTVASNGVGELHRDNLDLNSATSRRKFCNATMKVAFENKPPAEWPAGIETDLEQQLLAAARQPPGDPDPRNVPQAVGEDDPRVRALADTPEDIREEAASLLADPRLLERITDDVAATGVVGERPLVATLYLVAVSVQLPKPLSAIVRGASTSGKSFVVDRTTGMVPPEVIMNATSLTTNALYYFPEGTLRHRLIVAGERSRIEDDDRAEATRALREMIEAGRLSKAVAMKNVGGKIETTLIEQQGPISLVETTTLGNIFEEDANRCLLLATDESTDQTARVLEATARAAAKRPAADSARRQAVHYTLHRILPRCDVKIPFAEHVSALYPSGQLDARRSFRHLLGLVKASALLHFLQRQRDSDGNVIATLDDYAVAERLARDPFNAAASGVSEGARKFLTALREKFRDKNFSTTEAQDVGAGSRRSRYSRLNELNFSGAVEQTEPSRGKVPARWKLTGLDPDAAASVIPSVQSVAYRLPNRTHADNP